MLNAVQGGTPTVACLRNDEAEQIAKLEEEVEVQLPFFFGLHLQSIVYRLKKVRICFMYKFVKIVISCLCSVAGPASQISRAGNRCSRHQSGP